jgi:hypothetical protein
MNPGPSRIPYSILVAATDRILEDCEDDVECLALRLGSLEPDVRKELFVSDLLNAYQIFYFFFRDGKDDLLRERLELEPASALIRGIKIRENDFYTMIIIVREAEAVIALSDGEKIVATFTGSSAFEQGCVFMESPEYQ